MKAVLTKALYSGICFGVAVISTLLSFEVFDYQAEKSLQTGQNEWLISLTASVLLAFAICGVALGLLISMPKTLRRIIAWMK